jgi:hypothetical protein
MVKSKGLKATRRIMVTASWVWAGLKLWPTTRRSKGSVNISSIRPTTNISTPKKLSRLEVIFQAACRSPWCSLSAKNGMNATPSAPAAMV